MRHFITSLLVISFSFAMYAQTPEEIVGKVRAKLHKVHDYEAKGKMKTNVVFIKAPVATVKIFFKKPNKMRINNESDNGNHIFNIGVGFTWGGSGAGTRRP